MALNLTMKCASLGCSVIDKLILFLLGLIAPSKDRTNQRWWQLLSLAIPKIWIKPAKLNGRRLLIDPTNWSQTVIFEEVFLNSAYDLTKINFRPELILDCGAHIGIFSLLAKSTFPSARLVAFEPNPQNIQMIRRQITGNDLDMELVEAAISTETKDLFFSASNSHSGRLLHGEAGNEAYKVKAINFPEALLRMQPASLLIKMDIEGEERNVLPLILPLMPKQSALFFETHFGELGWLEIKNLLTANGFQVEQITARGQFYDGFAHRG